jgi:hypothetical protein
MGFTVAEGELRLVTLSFTTPNTLDAGGFSLVRIYQKNDKKVVTGGVFLQLNVI